MIVSSRASSGRGFSFSATLVCATALQQTARQLLSEVFGLEQKNERKMKIAAQNGLSEMILAPGNPK